MAFVSATPVVSSTPSNPLTKKSTNNRSQLSYSSTPIRASIVTEFQTYSGGLDRISFDNYSITRYLFKSRPATLEDQDKDVTINAGLRHVFGNAYLMDEERAEFYKAESKYRCGQITAKEFIRAVAKSETYRKRFFESVSQYRFIELNFKHFFGRAPLNQLEYSKHFRIFAQGGYEAEIDSYFDDPEYEDIFGEDYMPYTRFRGTYAPINQFNRMCSIQGGFAGSDKNKPQTLVTSIAANISTPAHTVADGLPPIPNAEHPSNKYNLPDASLERFRNELEIARAKAYEIQIELEQAYNKLDEARTTINPFKSMVADMNITPLYGRNYGNGAVTVFSGQYQGAPADSWGPSGVTNINGPTRRPAVNVGKKEKQLEGLKQLILDLERRVAVLEAEREKPAITPPAISFEMEGIEMAIPELQPAVVEQAPEPAVTAVVTPTAPVFTENIIIDDAPEDEDESGMITPREVVIETKRELKEVGKLPKELIEEMEEERIASGKEFGTGAGNRPEFPGDGSEMIIGG